MMLKQHRNVLPLCLSSRFLYQNVLKLSLEALKIGIVSALLGSLPAIAAEFVSVNYGLLQRSLPIESLEKYAKTGVSDTEIKSYLRYLKPEQREQFRQALLTQVPLSTVAVSQFLYTFQGEVLLERLGTVIRTSSTETGFYAIRGAMIAAAGDPRGLSLINVLRKFPTREVRIDIGEGLNIFTDINTLVNQTQAFILEAARTTAREALLNPLPPQPKLANLQHPGTNLVTRLRFILPKTQEQREVPVDLYLPSLPTKTTGLKPEQSVAQKTPLAPLLVISHGFGSDRTSFHYLAQHLSSYGFAVAVPEHQGSNAQQVQNWLSGRTALATEPAEFIKRPLDIRYLLDALTERARTDLLIKGRIDLQQVGIVGQSFGGYTAFAVAGAPIDPQHLRLACRQEANTLNLSLLLQCRALEIQKMPPLGDRRIKAVLAINPIAGAVFSETSFRQVSVPTLIVGSGNDTVAPILPEQVYPFSWLTTPQKYLVLIQNATHFSAIGTESGGSSTGLPVPEQVVGANPDITQRYLKMLSVAFFKIHLLNQPSYGAYLSDAYIHQASQMPFRLSMLRQIQPEMMAQTLQRK